MGNTIDLYSNFSKTTDNPSVSVDRINPCTQNNDLSPLGSTRDHRSGSYEHIDPHYTTMLKTKPMDKRKRRPSRYN